MNSESEMGGGVSGKVKKKYLQMGIWWFSLLIFVGYVMVWTVKPTNFFYLQWFPDIEAKADSIYFGVQGLSLSPMLELNFTMSLNFLPSSLSQPHTMSRIIFFIKIKIRNKNNFQFFIN